jgi:hypothetical protein
MSRVQVPGLHFRQHPDAPAALVIPFPVSLGTVSLHRHGHNLRYERSSTLKDVAINVNY